MGSETERIATGVIEKTLPKAEWTHHAHLRAGLWHVLHHDEQSGFDLMRLRIRAYNLATGVENTESGGYHETITRFYLIMIRGFVQDKLPVQDLDDLAELVIQQLGARELPLNYYSRELLFSMEARAAWVLPDLIPLP